jgi:hypothetical protein
MHAALPPVAHGEPVQGFVRAQAKKACRRLDHYVPRSGRNAVTPECDGLGIINIRSSRFLLPVPTRS